MNRDALTLCVVLLALGGCGPTTVGEGGLDGGGGWISDGGIWQGGDGGVVDPLPNDGCDERARLVYVVDENNMFSSFDPKQTPPVFNDLGLLQCPAEWGASPFSMSVDRDAIAWVLYSSGELFSVDIDTMLCSRSSFVRDQLGFSLFGMGFVSNSSGSQDETLFIAGGLGPGLGFGATLGTISMPGLQVSSVGSLSGWPELTGTGSAELWGFFPDTTPPKVVRIQKDTGGEMVSYPLASLQGEPRAWAFAFWGGDFWIFLQRQTENDTRVYQVKGGDGTMTTAVASTGRTIVGAGVSTCAPIMIE